LAEEVYVPSWDISGLGVGAGHRHWKQTQNLDSTVLMDNLCFLHFH
jgi:hypothetical protein